MENITDTRKHLVSEDMDHEKLRVPSNSEVQHIIPNLSWTAKSLVFWSTALHDLGRNLRTERYEAVKTAAEDCAGEQRITVGQSTAEMMA